MVMIAKPTYSYKREGDRFIKTQTGFTSGFRVGPQQPAEPTGFTRDQVDSSNGSGAIFYTKRNKDTGVIERFDRREVYNPVMAQRDNNPNAWMMGPQRQAPRQETRNTEYAPASPANFNNFFFGGGRQQQQKGIGEELPVFTKEIKYNKTGYAPGSMPPGGRQAAAATRRNDPVLSGSASEGNTSRGTRNRRSATGGGTILTPLGGKTILG